MFTTGIVMGRNRNLFLWGRDLRFSPGHDCVQPDRHFQSTPVAINSTTCIPDLGLIANGHPKGLILVASLSDLVYPFLDANLSLRQDR